MKFFINFRFKLIGLANYDKIREILKICWWKLGTNFIKTAIKL